MELNAPQARLIHPHVRILRFIAELGRELLVASVDVTMMARKNRTVSSVIGWEREAEHFPEPGVKAHVGAADPPNHTITERSGIPFALIDARDLNDAIQVAAKIPPAREGSIEVRPVRELQR